MICRLCLKDGLNVKNIFGLRGLNEDVAKIIAKHFWFEPKADDPISTAICNTCYTKIFDFDEYYNAVYEAHRLLAERFLFNPDNTTKAKDQICGKDKIWLSAQSPHTSSDESNSLKKKEIQNKTIDLHTDNKAVDDYEGETFFDTDLVDDYNINILHEEGNAKQILSNILDQLDDSQNNRRKRSTRSSPKNILHLPLIEKKNIEMMMTPKKRGRPRKLKTIKNENSNDIEDINSNAQETLNITELALKGINKPKKSEIDEKISRFLHLKCDICALEQATFYELRKHMLQTHECRRGYAICCEKKFYTRSLLLEHIEKHTNPECFSCKECKKSFAVKQCLRNHIIIKHQPEEAKTFVCIHCNKKFAKQSLLEQHRKMHEERNNICEICQKGFSTRNLLTAHVKVTHQNEGKMCEVCAKVIRNRSAFQRHVLEHKGVTLPKVQCPKCDTWLKDKYCLQKHIRRHNDSGEKHTCKECGKIAPNRSALLAHQRYVHKAKRIHQCGVCKKSFKKQFNLKEHMTTHTGETLYNCPHCTRTFNSNANMHSHRKKIHPKEFEEARVNRQKTVTDGAKPTSIIEVSQMSNKNEKMTLDIEEEAQILLSAHSSSGIIFKVT